MLNFVNPRRFFVAQYIVDFRKGPYGLLSEAMRAGVDPYAREFCRSPSCSVCYFVGNRDVNGRKLLY